MSKSFLPLWCAALILIHGSSDAQDAAPRWTSGKLTGTGSEPLPFLGINAFPKLETTRAVDLDTYPGPEKTRRLVLTEIGGQVWSFVDDPDTSQRDLLVDFAALDESPGNQRLYSIAFDPGFPKVPWMYVSLNTRIEGKGLNRIVRFTIDQFAPPRAAPDSEVLLLEWASAGHDGCDLKFGPDGYLYASTGDGESPGDPDNIGQKTDNLLGSILRIDVGNPEPDRPYRVPEDNPFVSFSNVPPEIWAYGLRNPWRMNFHPETGELFVGDNGDENWEMVRRVTAGSNHGWSAYEGSFPFRLTNALGGPHPELTVPVWEHPHTEMRSVIGGLFYRGNRYPKWQGRYFYGCYFTKKLWALKWDEMSKQASEPVRIADIGHAVVSFTEGHDRELLIVTHDGPIYRLAPAPQAQPKPIPTTLSATGLFSEAKALTPAEGVIPYSINVEPWADGAQVVRHFALPPEVDIKARAGENEQKSWQFPDGSAFARTIQREKVKGSGEFVRIETQVMHIDREEWRFLSYRWRADQSDADLVPENGETQPCQVGDLTLSYRFPSRGECSACHTQRSFFALGLSTEQLNRPLDSQDPSVSQIDQFVSMGLFQKGQEPRPAEFPALSDPHDDSAPLDQRARNYLHVNCAHCHRETGLGGRAQFELLHWLSLTDTHAVNARPLVGLPGIGDAGRVIAPGHPELSEIVRRMGIRGPNQMPLIGSDQVDHDGIALIERWISQLPNTLEAATKPTEKP